MKRESVDDSSDELYKKAMTFRSFVAIKHFFWMMTFQVFFLHFCSKYARLKKSHVTKKKSIVNRVQMSPISTHKKCVFIYITNYNPYINLQCIEQNGTVEMFAKPLFFSLACGFNEPNNPRKILKWKRIFYRKGFYLILDMKIYSGKITAAN